MIGSSLCMYSLEHKAQPEVFTNAFSGIWWSASTLLTVGYGDIYPITTLGKMFGIFITFLGVGMVAIPTGIISAGFVDQYSRIKRIAEIGPEADIHYHQNSSDRTRFLARTYGRAAETSGKRYCFRYPEGWPDPGTKREYDASCERCAGIGRRIF